MLLHRHRMAFPGGGSPSLPLPSSLSGNRTLNMTPGRATPWVPGRQLPRPLPLPQGGLRPSVNCQRGQPEESMGAEDAQRSMGTKGA